MFFNILKDNLPFQLNIKQHLQYIFTQTKNKYGKFHIIYIKKIKKFFCINKNNFRNFIK
jgi:hypothetical protein